MPDHRTATPDPMTVPSASLPATGDDRLWYVYAVGRAEEALRAVARETSGLYGEPLHAIECEGLAVLASPVPAADFHEQALKAQLEQLDRLETLARIHDGVVARAGTRTTVLPMRLATVYVDTERVAEMLRQGSDQFASLLAHLTGHQEWGVKVYALAASAAPPSSPVSRASAGPERSVSPGRAFLQERRAQRRSRQDAFRAAGAVAARVTDTATAFARDRVAHRPQQGGPLATKAGENISNEAYLVPVEHAAAFRDELTALGDAEAGVHVEVTGPWAPYSFATPGNAAAAGRGAEHGRDPDEGQDHVE
ncbi:GvpL/GvpF family gas vesicle protein [Streptomyces sp. NPDC048491]|uniref:GvpL/GvpF family gas vesicle protein n=1 Tax=Streptomyces sp. NPDC048491 TaxID=3157207 RepID=UPI00344A4B9E